jgi:hypothetical protein
MKHLVLLSCLLFLCCAPVAVLRGTPSSFRYSSIAHKHIAYTKPIVISSEIFYENRFTSQSYHSIDKIRTQEAFSRDFFQRIIKAGLGWKEIDYVSDSILQKTYGYTSAPLDSLCLPVRQRLATAGIDIVVMVYAMRLYHYQTVGIRRDKTGSVNSYGTLINKRVEYVCSVMDIPSNRPVFCIPVRQEENSLDLNILENSVTSLFDVLLRR